MKGFYGGLREVDGGLTGVDGGLTGVDGGLTGLMVVSVGFWKFVKGLCGVW